MMKIQLKQIFVLLVITFASKVALAQVDTTLVMNPDLFTPNPDSGYFVTGALVDIDDDGEEDDFVNGCYDGYGDDDHREGGTQNGWEYDNVIIFNQCDTASAKVDDVIKGKPREQDRAGWPAKGSLIQLTKAKYLFTDSAAFGYIASPGITNLKSINVKVSTDVSIQDRRPINFLLEASLDGGETWEYMDNFDGTAWVIQGLETQGGESHTFTEGGGSEGFDAIVAASKNGSIRVRLATVQPPQSEANGERLKVWWMEVEAQLSDAGGELSNSVLRMSPQYQIFNGQFLANPKESLHVFNLSGVLIGQGESVDIPSKGLYIIRTSTGYTEKVFIK